MEINLLDSSLIVDELLHLSNLILTYVKNYPNNLSFVEKKSSFLMTNDLLSIILAQKYKTHIMIFILQVKKL
jgi:hypothetical protein